PQPRHTLSSTRTPPTETYPLSLHDALPIYERVTPARERPPLRRRVLHVTRDQVHGLSHGPRRAAHRAPDTDGQRVHHRRALAAQVYVEVARELRGEVASGASRPRRTVADLVLDPFHPVAGGLLRVVGALPEVRGGFELTPGVRGLLGTVEGDVEHAAPAAVHDLQTGVHAGPDVGRDLLRELCGDVVDRLHA